MTFKAICRLRTFEFRQIIIQLRTGGFVGAMLPRCPCPSADNTFKLPAAHLCKPGYWHWRAKLKWCLALDEKRQGQWFIFTALHYASAVYSVVMYPSLRNFLLKSGLENLFTVTR